MQEWDMKLRPASLVFLLCLLSIAALRRRAADLDAAGSRPRHGRARKESSTRPVRRKGHARPSSLFWRMTESSFGPDPLNGKEVWGKRPETGFDLIWEPTFAVIARSADFGYDTGPAKWRANKKEEKFTGHGQFISIWKKQKDGSWKVALDCGIENPEPTGKPETLRTGRAG